LISSAIIFFGIVYASVIHKPDQCDVIGLTHFIQCKLKIRQCLFNFAVKMPAATGLAETK